MDSAAVSTRRARFSLVASLGVISTAGLNLGPRLTPRSAPLTTSDPSPGPSQPANVSPSDRQLREMIVGRWRTESHGTRVVTNRPDGTASMDVTFDFIASLVYGEKMKLELRWGVEKGVLTYTIQS